MEQEPTAVLARFAATLEYDDIPERTRAACKGLLLDALACALAGHRGDETHQVAALAAGLAQSKESSVIGGDRLSLAGATLLNGYLTTAVTMCDVHRPTATHVSPEVVPPALAIAERHARSGRDLLVAIAAGCETTTRVGIGLDYPAFRGRGWHGPGVIGPFGAAAAAGRLLGFDADTMATAFGLAGSQSAGTYAAWGTPTVKFHQCRGALSGLLAALLAEQRFAATRQFLTAPDGGLYATYSNGGRPQAVTDALGERWELEQIALRPWPSASAIQSMITATFELVEKHGLRPERTKMLRISLGKAAFDLHGGFSRWEGKFEALLSAHYAATVVLHDRDSRWRSSSASATPIPPCGSLPRSRWTSRAIPPWPAPGRWWKRTPPAARPSPCAASIRAGRRRIRCRGPSSSGNFARTRRSGSPTPASRKRSASCRRWRRFLRRGR
jgi:2-methylcitrate dehydratase PrpD